MDYGLNVLTMKYGNLIKSGGIDPVKVVRLTIENASSLAGLAFTGECLIVEKPEDKKEPYGPDRR
jgi:chaperonin GroEL